MSLRSRIGWSIHSAIQSYYRPKVSARVLEHAGARTASKAYPPQFVDLVRLTRFVRERRPSVVWEFGSGWSTQYLAQALADNGAGKLYSLDADAFWSENAQAMLPPWLGPFAEMRHVPCKQMQVQGACAWKYDWRPDDMPQLIYVDGPAGAKECPGNADLLEIEERLAPGCLIVIDGRAKTAEFLRTKFRREWRYWEDLGPFGRFFSQFNQRYLELMR
ncbi:MAG: class I SAM-dependent methyltransferase [Alphaproteobacteria bacterium]|nr:class I SAM-dependent methyltransferase [Alphaproteobacteria bacterium]